MKRLSIIILSIALLSGCAGGSKLSLMGATEKGKSAELKYTSIGLTSDFEFKGIATGTYKSLGAEGGLIYYKGTQNVQLTLDAAEKWDIKATSKKQNFLVGGLGLRLQNPYVADIKHNGKLIGNIGLNLPKIDKTKTVLKMVGLDNVINKNLDLSGSAKILGSNYKIESVYKGTDGVKKNSPYGYRVKQGNTTLGLVQAGKNLMGGQKLQVWLAPGLSPVKEQSVMAILLVCGYVI